MHFKFSNDLNENLKFNEVTFGKYSNDTKYYKSKSNYVTKEILNLIYAQ